MAQERRTIWYSGTVQGVGFRYTASRIATRYDVTGRIRNLRDGRVECIVEGPIEQIEAFLEDLGEQMSGYIRNVQQETTSYTGTYREFTFSL